MKTGTCNKEWRALEVIKIGVALCAFILMCVFLLNFFKTIRKALIITTGDINFSNIISEEKIIGKEL